MHGSMHVHAPKVPRVIIMERRRYLKKRLIFVATNSLRSVYVLIPKNVMHAQHARMTQSSFVLQGRL